MAHELGHEGFGAAAEMGPYGQGMGVLNTLGGSAKAGQQAMDYARQLYPDSPEADPWEAAFRFFAEMGKAASVPGATVLGSAVGSMQVPMDYLAAKKKEKRETDRARMTTAVSLAPSLKAPVVKATYGKPDFYMVSNQNEDGTFTDPIETALTPKQFSQIPTDGTVRVTSVPKAGTASTYKEQKFYKTGFPAAVVKNSGDADGFNSAGWSTVPPEGWEPPAGSKTSTTVQSSKILDGNVTVSLFSDGTKEVRDRLGKIVTGADAFAAVTEAEDRGIEIQGDRSQQRGLGDNAAKIVIDSYDEMAKVRTNIDTLEDAKRALESGAQTGFFAQFLPDISRSATELANVKNRLGLDVVSSVTFGALSEAELNMALNTALPTNMDEDYLKGWVQERIDAKKKLLANLQEVTGFLARGNSIGDWMVELDKRATTSQDEITPLATEISTMSIEEIDAIDLATAGLSNAELQAYIKRANELGAN
jgi:hypothetical protein